MNIQHIRIGTRGSALALAQTKMVEEALKGKYPNISFERVIMKTEADRHNEKALSEFGGEGVFVKELENALLSGRIDIAVHSAKDMPVRTAEGLCIAGVLPRGDMRDVLVYRKELSESFDNIKTAIRIGTGSPRRQSQIEALYPNIICEGIRGNVPTRLDKVRNGRYDGVILAAAGLERLGMLKLPEFNYRYFTEDEMLPAGGQAVIAIEARMSDDIVPFVEAVSDEKSFIELSAEQYVLRGLDAGCHEPVAVRAHVKMDEISISLAYGTRSLKGDIIRVCRKGKREEWEQIATELVKIMCSRNQSENI
ncbi:MAG: hydroxymethylbilane synthase [Lachnospiraceae bacterium]|nr:hydroxymethylbilane synthase [Lachnospiraceae bacterium]